MIHESAMALVYLAILVPAVLSEHHTYHGSMAPQDLHGSMILAENTWASSSELMLALNFRSATSNAARQLRLAYVKSHRVDQRNDRRDASLPRLPRSMSCRRSWPMTF